MLSLSGSTVYEAAIHRRSSPKLPPLPDAPAFALHDARVAGGGALCLWLDPLWSGWAMEGVSVALATAPGALSAPGPGVSLVEGLPDGAPASVAIRVERAVQGVSEAGPWSVPQLATPTAGTALAYAAFTGTPLARPAMGEAWIAAGATLALAGQAVTGPAALGPVTTALGARVTPGPDGAVAHDAGSVALAPGAAVADGWHVVRRVDGDTNLARRLGFGGAVRAASSGSAGVWVETTTETASRLSTWTKGASTGSASLLFNIEGTAHPRRLIPGQPYTIRFTANATATGTLRPALTSQGGGNSVGPTDISVAAGAGDVAFSATIVCPPPGTGAGSGHQLRIIAGSSFLGSVRDVVMTGPFGDIVPVSALTLAGPAPEPALAAARVAGLPPGPAFRVADAVTDGTEAWLWVDPDWPGWAAGAALLDWRAGAGPAVALPPMGGLHRLSGLPGAAAISLRTGLAGEPGPWSTALTVTPTAESTSRFAVWADGFHAAPLAESVTHVGETAATTAALNRPLKLSGGEELEVLGGAQSLWVKHFGYLDFPAAPNPLPEVRHRFFEPAGRHVGLAPCATAIVPFRLRVAGDVAERAGQAVVLGAAGGFTQPAMAAVALDAAGDPVSFRFDRLHPVGQLPDGRAFVVAPHGLRLMSNDGRRISVPADRVATWRGAALLVVRAAGLVPTQTLAVDIALDYATTGPAPDWAGWPAVRGGAGVLTVQPNFETLHVYLRSAATAEAAVRFRKAGSAAWMPAQPLVHDARVPATTPVDMASVTPGNHRGVILHLAPATAYEVEVRQGTDLYAATVSTRSHKTAKASLRLGTVDGDVTIARSGPLVTVTRAGLPTVYFNIGTATHAELHDGRVRGGTVTVDGPGLILRDIDVLAPPRHGITLGPNAADVRIIRGRIASWGASDLGDRPENVGWSRKFEAAINACEAHTTNRDVAVIGLRTGAPRHPANSWEHYNPSVGGPYTPGTGNHPWGALVIGVKQGSHAGGWAVADCSFAGHHLRPCEDLVNGNNNMTRGVGGLGPNSWMAHCYGTGATDDGLEIEGSNQCAVFLGNWIDLERNANYTRGPRAGVSISTGYWGPTVLARNVFRFLRPEPGWVVPPGPDANGRVVNDQGAGIKVQRAGTEPPAAEMTGLVVLDHNTVFAPVDDEAPMAFFTNSASVTAHVTVRNNLARQRNAFQAETGVAVTWTGNDVDRASTAPLAFVAGTAIAPSAAAVPGLANRTDGGPWATISPVAGAAA